MPNNLLRIYRAPSGEWSGRVFEDGDDVAGIAGCASPEEVEAAAYDQGWQGFAIEVADDEELPAPSTSQRLAAYETALEIYNFLIAGKSALLGQERSKATPDEAVIAQLIAEQGALRQQSRALDFNDRAPIEHVISTLGPVVKRDGDELRRQSR